VAGADGAAGGVFHRTALNVLTVLASVTELGRLFQIFTMRTEKK